MQAIAISQNLSLPLHTTNNISYNAPMTLQIFGTKKSTDTRKAERYLKERSIPYQFIDLNQKGPSQGELQSILRYLDAEDLIDTNAKLYKKGGYAYMEFDPVEEVLEHPERLTQPLIRGKAFASAGFNQEAQRALQVALKEEENRG